MAGLEVPSAGSPVIFAGVDLWTHAWAPESFPLNTRVKRRQNTLMPGQPGRRGNQANVDESVHSIPMLFVGDAEPDGTPVANEAAGLAANLAEFIETVVEATEDARGTIEAVVGLSTTRVQIDSFITEEDAGATFCLAILSVRVPGGRWIPTDGGS